MKTIKWMILTVAVFSLTSCLKDETTAPGEETIAAAQFLNALPGSDGLIVALDNNQLNNMNYLEFFRSGELLGYRRIFAGTRMFRVFLPEDVASNIELKREELSFSPGNFYSVFLTGESEEDFEVIQVEDVVEEPEEGRARLRFIHLDADVPAVDFGVMGEDTPLAPGITYKSYTDFMDIPAGDDIDFYITGEVSGDTYEFTFKPVENRIYTVWMKDTISHGVIMH